MKALFGLGLHPLGGQQQANLEGPDLTAADHRAVTRLGAPFKVFDHDISRSESKSPGASLPRTTGCPGIGPCRPPCGPDPHRSRHWGVGCVLQADRASNRRISPGKKGHYGEVS